MRIALYGMPTSGKTYILNRIDFIETILGSQFLREYDPDFDNRDEFGRKQDRKAIAKLLKKKHTFIMDGHYSFGNEIAFTKEDGELYDVFLYLYISPSTLRDRMEVSDKNRKYLKYDITDWQVYEIDALRQYCHDNNKDFYVIDNPPLYYFNEIEDIIDFIKQIIGGYSCISYAKKCAEHIISKSKTNKITLLDGDKTLTVEDSSRAVFGYKTSLYDGNFYTGYQAWRQSVEFDNISVKEITELPVILNDRVIKHLSNDSYILTSGHNDVWKYIADYLDIDYFSGMEMSAETKFFVTKFLQKAGKEVIAYGDGMNDYYMLKKADVGYLVTKKDGSISKSLIGKNMEGILFV